MPLYSLEDERQSAIGKRDHWNQFRHFQGSPLHAAFIAELGSYLDEQTINSSHVGSDILAKIQSQSPHLLQSYPQDQVSGLFGMTLWNLLAEHPASWYFYRKPNSLGELRGMTYFRRP